MRKLALLVVLSLLAPFVCPAQYVAPAGFNKGASSSVITIVQETDAGTTCTATAHTTCVLAFASNNTAGNLLIYMSAANSGTNGQLTVATDSNSNTIANAIINQANSNGAVRVDCVNVSNSGANTVTAHTSVSLRIHLHIWEVSGMSATACSSLDASSSNTATQTATSQSVSTSGATTHANDLVFGVFYDFTSNGTLSAGSGFGTSLFSNGGAGLESCLTETKIVSSTGTQTATATNSSGTDLVRQIVLAFKGT